MKSIIKHTEPKYQCLISIFSVTIVGLLCLFIRDVVEYKVVGYLLLVVVSLLAIFLDILPVLLGASAGSHHETAERRTIRRAALS